MKNYHVVLLIITLGVAVISYIALENIFIALGVLVIYLLVSFLLVAPLFKKYDITKNRFHECYHFINNFIISLSIKKSITGALETATGSMPSEFVDLYQSLENMSEDEKLNYLSTYFTFHDYQLFLQVISLWEDEGGDIIEMSKYLISNVRNNEEYISYTDTIAKRKYVEIGILWTISLAIIAVLRFALNDFYEQIKTQVIFIVPISLIFLFVLVSIYWMSKKGTYLDLKGGAIYEKES